MIAKVSKHSIVFQMQVCFLNASLEVQLLSLSLKPIASETRNFVIVCKCKISFRFYVCPRIRPLTIVSPFIHLCKLKEEIDA